MNERKYGFTPICDICGDEESVTYYKWHKEDEYKDIVLCNKHYTQLSRHGHLLDTIKSKHQKRVLWTDEEKKELEQYYKDGKSFEEISKLLNRTIGSISAISSELKLGEKYMRNNNPKFKAVYQDYDWCYERYINRKMSMEEMAKEANTTLRTIQKWCSEKHKLNNRTFKDHVKLTSKQYDLIEVGILGDGHIDRRENQPMYIESHAIDEKDYLFYKYEILKDLCNKSPVYKEDNSSNFSTDKVYDCKPTYRLNTRIISELKEIREKNKVDIIKNLSEWQICLLFLDDGSRSDLWELCVAEWSQDEINALFNRLYDLNIRGKQLKDIRYINFDAYSSKNLDELILKNIPNDLDIIKKKIIDNKKIRKYHNQFYVITPTKRIGISTYCRSNGYSYIPVRDKIKNMDLKFPEINEDEFISIMKKYKIGA